MPLQIQGKVVSKVQSVTCIHISAFLTKSFSSFPFPSDSTVYIVCTVEVGHYVKNHT